MKQVLLPITVFTMCTMLSTITTETRAESDAVGLRKTDTGFIIAGTDKDAATFEIDSAGNGFVRSVKIGGKNIVDANKAPPLFASVLESPGYDGFADFAAPDGGKVIPATYRLDKCTAAPKGSGVEVVTTGRLDWDAADAIRFEMRTMLQASGHMRVVVKADRQGTFKDRFLREFGLRLPLSLNERKRVVQAGDRGMRFDTRFEYQYHAHVGFLESADFNFWQHFWIDQASPADYHMWRSESLSTSGLTEFRGRLAPGWTTAYDQQGGVLLSYKDMPLHAPKALYVNARNHGTAVIYFHAPTHRAMDMRDSVSARRVFDMTHQTDWIFFQGEESSVKPDQMLAKIWDTKLTSDGPQRADDELNKINVSDARLTAGADAPLVASGVPLPQGAVAAPSQLSLSQNDQEVPLQTRVEGYWPDGSIKWVLLIFPLDADKSLTVAPSTGSGQTLPLTVTLRDDKVNQVKRTFILKYGRDVRNGQVASPLKAGTSGADVRIDTGPLQLRLGKGECWLAEAKLNGRSLLGSDNKPMSFADFVRTQTYAPNTANPAGKADDGGLVIQKVELEEAGPLRAMVRLEGMTTSQEPMKVILRLEAYAGRSYVRMFHSIEFLQKDPRIVFLRKMGIHLPIELDAKDVNAVAVGQDGAVAIPDAGTSARLGLSQDGLMHFSAWRQGAGDRFLSVMKDGNRSRGWLDVSDSKGGIAVVIRNMWQEAPSELVVTTGVGGGAGAAFDVNLWPESSPVMDVRRYSNYGHMSQGESAGEIHTDNSFWAEEVYYGRAGREPFLGVSKTHEMLLYFHGPAVTPAAIDSLAADFQRPALVYAGAKWYAEDTKVILPTILPGDPKYALAEQNMRTGASFLLFHQDYWNWYGMWDYGDVGHMFKRGYGQMVPAKRLAEILKMSPDQRAALRDRDIALQDYWPQHDWAFDNGRWGWSNTEGLTNLFMQLEYLRTGDRDIYFFSEAAAREARDVVMRHEGWLFGFGTRHGVQHWSDGNHEQRQTINAEFRYNYFLSGDMRSADFAQDLTDNFYMKAPISSRNDADHSARLYGLLFAWERTNDAKYARTLENYVHALCTPDGIDVRSAVSFPEGKRTEPVKRLNSGSFFFQYFGSMHALLEYYELTHDEVLRNALVKFAQNGSGDMVGGNRKLSPPVLAQAFAARYADNTDSFRRELAERITSIEEMYRLAYQTWPTDKSHWTGPTAPVTHYPIAMFWLNSEGYVLGALDKEPPLSADQLQVLKQKSQYTEPEEKGQPASQTPVRRESWQNELDDPTLKSYTTPKRKLEP